MSAASSRSARTLLGWLLVAALSLSLALAPAATADQGGGGNEARAINEKDGSSVFELAFDVRRVSSNVVDQTNSAVAYSSCESCQTVAVAFQIVLVSGSPDTVTPTNLAVALNEECTTCQTLALAYQFVFGTGEPLEFTKDGRERLKEIRKGLKALGDEGLTPDEIRAGAQALADEVALLLSTGLAPRDPEDLEGDDGETGEEDDTAVEEDDLQDDEYAPEDEESVSPEDEVQPEDGVQPEDESEPEPVEPVPAEPGPAPTEPAPEEDPAAPAEP